MLAINRTDLPIALEGEGVEVRATEAGELTAGWFSLAKGVDLDRVAPLYEILWRESRRDSRGGLSYVLRHADRPELPPLPGTRPAQGQRGRRS